MILRSISIRPRVATCGATWNGCVQAWKSRFANLLSSHATVWRRRASACANAGAAWIALFVRRVYEANFAHDLDIAQPSVLVDCLDRLVEDPAAVLATARGNEAKSCLRRNTERAVDLGIFGAPMTVVGNELFWGNDRLEAALAWQRAGRD